MWPVWLSRARVWYYKYQNDPSCFHPGPAWWQRDPPPPTTGLPTKCAGAHTPAHSNAALPCRGWGIREVLHLTPSGRGCVTATAGSPISWLESWFEKKETTKRTTTRAGQRDPYEMSVNTQDDVIRLWQAEVLGNNLKDIFIWYFCTLWKNIFGDNFNSRSLYLCEKCCFYGLTLLILQ